MKITELNINKLDGFKNHPFKVVDDLDMKELEQSIINNGLLEPILVRPKESNRFEIISGHRRIYALKQIGIDKVPCIIKDLSDDQAVIEMVDSNIRRENVLPSEKAKAYKMKLTSMKHQGKKVHTSDHDGPKLTTEKIGLEFGDSSTNVKRYVRLTYLEDELLNIVDNSYLEQNAKLSLGITTAVELSYLSKEDQLLLLDAIDYNQATPSRAQAIQIRKLSENKQLTVDALDQILSEEKGNQHQQIAFNKENIERVLPKELIKRDKRYIEQYIIKAIQNYNNHLENNERGDDYDLAL